MDIGLQVASILLTVLLAGVGIEMANNPPEKNDTGRKWIYRSIFGLIGLLLIFVTVYQAERNSANELSLKTQNGQTQAKLDNITQLVLHPPSNFDPKQIVDAATSLLLSQTSQRISSISPQTPTVKATTPTVFGKCDGKPIALLSSISDDKLRNKAQTMLSCLNKEWADFNGRENTLQGDLGMQTTQKAKDEIQKQIDNNRNDFLSDNGRYVGSFLRDELLRRFGPNEEANELKTVISYWADIKEGAL
jgi:hypothetical protein